MKEIRIHFHVQENPLDNISEASLVYRFCPKCDAHMVLWSEDSAKCVQCKTEWAFVDELLVGEVVEVGSQSICMPIEEWKFWQGRKTYVYLKLLLAHAGYMRTAF
jgi:hypothetical protein